MERAGAILVPPPHVMGGGKKYPWRVAEEPGGGWEDPRTFEEQMRLVSPMDERSVSPK